MSFVDRWINSMPDNYGPLPGAQEEAVCLQGAEEGMVLLKNNGVLPLEDKKIALFGAGAMDTIICGTGSGSILAPYQISVEQGLSEDGYTITSRRWLDKFDALSKEANASNENNKEAIFFKLWGGGTVLIDEPEITEEELREAKKAETALYVVRRNTGEGFDRKDIPGDFRLSDMETKNLSKLAAAFVHTVVVLNTSVMDCRFLEQNPGIDAVLLMNLPGMLAGKALANVLSGRVSPSGKLADTWAMQYSDYPTAEWFSDNDGETMQEDYREGIYVGYRYFDSFQVEPRWPFGFGLSYTEFSLTCKTVTAVAETVSVPVTVRNTGAYSGKEVVQVYVSAPQTQHLPKPYQELRGFVKTRLLAPGEEETVTVTFPIRSLASFDETRAAWLLEKGTYLIRVGNSSRATVIAAQLKLEQDVITELVSHNAACPRKIDLIQAPLIAYEETEAPIISIQASMLETVDHRNVGAKEIVTYVPEGVEYTPYVEKNPYQMRFLLPERVVHVRNTPDATFLDVAEGKVTLEEFTASLPKEVLIRLVSGIANETPFPIANRMTRKVTMVDAIPSSGRTTAQYVESLGIPNSYLTDGPAGLHLFGKPTAAWPVGAVLAQTWNLELMEHIGDGFGVELESYHQDVLLGPGINIHRDPMGGRTFEYYSEDPFLTGKLAVAFTKGVQSHPGIMVAIKHFCCNNQETDRAVSSSNVDERTLREIYLKAFEIAIKESKPGTIMTSYNCLNGIHTSEHRELLENIARGEWGFDGMFMTDWHSESYKPADYHAGNDIVMGGIQDSAILQAMEGISPVFETDGSVEVKTIYSYDGIKSELVESWGSFVPDPDGQDTVTAVIVPGIHPGENVQKYIDSGIASTQVLSDGTTEVIYRGTERGRHLALGDLQRCAMDVLKYLLRTSAWKEMYKSMQTIQNNRRN